MHLHGDDRGVLFERVMRRRAALDDGIVDGLFTFSRPIIGAYY
ncbi:MAG: hypothetical protein ACYC9Z_15220 [Casimicrobiaceae bacterium]